MVAPGSLDYLYYNGILDTIPYEAYETVQAYRPRYVNNHMSCDTYYPMNQPQKIQKRIPTWLKGLASLGIIVATVCCLFKGKKAPTQQVANATKTNFWSKLNPKNWIK